MLTQRELKDTVYGKSKIHADPEYANELYKVIMQTLFPTTVLGCFVSVLTLDGMFREAVFPKCTVPELKLNALV